MFVRKIKINETGEIQTLCSSCYQTMIAKLRDTMPFYLIINPADPSAGVLQIIDTFDTDWLCGNFGNW